MSNASRGAPAQGREFQRLTAVLPAGRRSSALRRGDNAPPPAHHRTPHEHPGPPQQWCSPRPLSEQNHAGGWWRRQRPCCL